MVSFLLRRRHFLLLINLHLLPIQILLLVSRPRRPCRTHPTIVSPSNPRIFFRSKCHTPTILHRRLTNLCCIPLRRYTCLTRSCFCGGGDNELTYYALLFAAKGNDAGFSWTGVHYMDWHAEVFC